MASNAKHDPSLKIISPIGRVAFPHLFEAHAFEAGKEPQFGVTLVFDNPDELKELRDTCVKAAIAKFGDKDKVKAIKNFKWPWRKTEDSEYEDKYGEPFVAGTVFVGIRSKNPPGVVNERAKPVMNHMDVYAGCYGRASFLCYAFDSMGNKGVTLLLNNFQKTGDGEKLSGRVSAEDEFEPVKGAATATAGDDDDIF